MWCGLWSVGSQRTRFNDQVSMWLIQQAISAIWGLVSWFSTYVEIRTLSIIFAKPGHMADTLLMPGLPSSRSLWLSPMSMLSFPPNWWWRSWASHNLFWPFTLNLLMNAPKASWKTCPMHGMWFLNAGHSIPVASRVNYRSRVIDSFEEAISVVITSKWPLVSGKQSRASF